jgi:CheY-like chemotaxis protein
MNERISSADAAPDGALILVVDDEFDLLSAYTMFLEQLGYRIRTASNGREALACALNERPDIVVSDFMMPIMDGAQLCRELRANPALSSVPFILCSAGRLRNDVPIPYDTFFSKPVLVDRLVNEINRLVARRDAP